MALTDQQINQKCMFFIALRTEKDTEEKIKDIVNYIAKGGDVNHVDGNDDDNSPLHIAVKRSEKDVVQYLVQNRAVVTQKNRAGETPMDLALAINTDVAREIIDILKKCNVPLQVKDIKNATTNTATVKKEKVKTSKEVAFQKTIGTSGVGGQLYETKLLSLILMRAVNDKDITRFCLATNLRLVGALDDIFFMYKVGNDDKVIVLAIQTKHRQDINKGHLTVNDLFRDSGDFSLPKYFDSYLSIKERLPTIISESTIADAGVDTELNLVLYTSVKDMFDMKTDKNNSQCPKINKLIQTGKNGVAFQFEYSDEHLNMLTRLIQENRVKFIGKTFLDFIMSSKKIQNILIDPLMRQYHVVLSRKVLQITASNDSVIARFKSDFFNTKEDMIDLLRDTIFKETVHNYCSNNNLRKEEIVILCKKLIKEPTSSNLSEIIGKIVTYDDKSGKLKFTESIIKSKEFNDDEKKKLQQEVSNVEVTSSVVYEATRIAGQKRLGLLEFKLPAYFGTFDLLKKNENKINKQLNFIAAKFKTLFECERNIIEITENDIKTEKDPDKEFEYRFFEISDGIGGAVGNLIIQDDATKLLKFNTSDVLPERANKLLLALKSVLPKGKQIDDYRLKICLKTFPRLSFSDDEYDKCEAKEFLGRLWFYTSQAKEDGVEVNVKKEIGKYYNVERGEDHFQFRIHSDAVYLRFHDEIQKWWMRPFDAPYLTKDSEIFEKVKKDIVDNPLLTVLKIMYLNKLKKIYLEFSIEAVKALNLDFYEDGIINIVTECNLLTGIKLKQYFKKNVDVIFIDFDYVLSLPANNYNTMFTELQSCDAQTLIVVYEPPKNTTGVHEKLKLIFDEFKGPRIIIVTDKVLGSELESNFPSKYNKIEDQLNCIDQFVSKSQRKFLEDTTITFQGQEVDLLTIIDEESFHVLKPHTVNKLVNKEKLDIGRSVTNEAYEQNKKLFVARHLRIDEDEIQVNTFQDVDDEIVIITAKPGMGKATLLTHLSVEHKKLYASSWIVRIDLADHLHDFETWQNNSIIVDKSKYVKFMCTVALKSVHNNTIFELEERESKVVLVDHHNLDDLAVLELELFLYYYNKNRIILLFNGFSDACPPYDKQVMNIIRIAREDNIRIWITCSLYMHAINILQKEFGKLYSLEPINSESQKGFFYKFFSTNLKIEKLNHEQFMNISDFFQYFTGIDSFGKHERVMMAWISLPLQVIYFVAMKFFNSEFNNITSKRISDTFKDKYDFDMDRLTTLGSYLETPRYEEQAAELAGTPLYMYVAANYFVWKIKGKDMKFDIDNRELNNKWDLIVNSFSLYKRFLETNLQGICYDGVRKRDVEGKRKSFFDKHKKLALLAICKEDHLKQLLTEDEVRETRNLVNRLQTGEERSEVVDCVLNKVPKFFHMLLAEYCVLDYIIELMKKTDINDTTKQRRLWDVIVNILLYSSPKSVRRAFDYKLKNDSEIASLTNTDQCRKIIFDLLLRGDETGENSSGTTQSPLDFAVDEGLSNLVNVLVKAIEVNLKEDNVTKLVNIIEKGSLLLRLFDSNYKDVGIKLLSCIRNIDGEVFTRLTGSQALVDIVTQSMSNMDDEVANKIREELLRAKEMIQSHLKSETVVLIRGICHLFKNASKNRSDE